MTRNSFWYRLWRNRSARAGVILLGSLALMALAAPLVAPYPPDARATQGDAPAPPSPDHWLGVDADQKDVLSRVIYGSRLSLMAGALSILLALALGSTLGALAGYHGSWVEAGAMRAVDVALAFPAILVALLVTTAWRPGWGAVVIAVGLINVPLFARQTRSIVMSLKHHEFVEASRALGASTLHILGRAILPGLVNPLLALSSLALGTAILEVAGLSFLGIGGDPTEPEWGSMLAQAKDHLSQSVWPAVGPGVAISVTVLACYLLGNGLERELSRS